MWQFIGYTLRYDLRGTIQKSKVLIFNLKNYKSSSWKEYLECKGVIVFANNEESLLFSSRFQNYKLIKLWKNQKN